jgi:putative ABC transport system ATP-binding protein/lipoprotein-releasing system ATP-binding protein
MIILQGVEKSYQGDGVSTHALKDIHIAFKDGEFTAIVGPSGSGKSTLLNIIGTIDRPTRGSVQYDGTNIQELKNNRLADFRFDNIGFIFQQFHLLPTLTALENVMSPLFARRVSFSKEERAKELLDLVGLGLKMNSLSSQLSGGEQQRVAIARAVVNEPKWILADEPTGNLDSNNGENIFQLLRELNIMKKCGIILITHDEKLARSTNRMITMADGRIIKESQW